MIAKNIKLKARQGAVFHELKEKSVDDWNAACALQRRKIFLSLFNFDPQDDAEAVQALSKIFQKISR